MLFTHDTQDALQMMAALVNTAGEPDELATLADLDAFLSVWVFTGRVDHDEAELAALRRLRARLAGFFDVDEQGLADGVNALLREGRALPQLVRHDAFDWHIHATDEATPLAVRMTVEFAMSMIDVVRADGLDRMQRCAAPGCGQVLIDFSRNRSRRFCDTGCGNRVNVAAYRARRRAAG